MMYRRVQQLSSCSIVLSFVFFPPNYVTNVFLIRFQLWPKWKTKHFIDIFILQNKTEPCWKCNFGVWYFYWSGNVVSFQTIFNVRWNSNVFQTNWCYSVAATGEHNRATSKTTTLVIPLMNELWHFDWLKLRKIVENQRLIFNTNFKRRI